MGIDKENSMKRFLLSLLLLAVPAVSETHHLKYSQCELFEPATCQMFFVSACVCSNFQGVNTSHDTLETGYHLTVWDVDYVNFSTLRVDTTTNSCLVSFYSCEASEISYLQFKQNIDMFLGSNSQELDWLDGQCYE